MIDPYNITNFNRTEAELQEFWLFSICVAGKGADQQSKKLDAFLKEVQTDQTPFEKVRAMVDNDTLGEKLRDHRIGQYSRIEKSFKESLALDLRTAPLQALESVFGVSFKTSRFFVMHSRPDVRVAALDTHILKFLRLHGHDAPKNTPSSSKQYAVLEQIFIDICDGQTLSIADIDLIIWTHFSNREEADKTALARAFQVHANKIKSGEIVSK